MLGGILGVAIYLVAAVLPPWLARKRVTGLGEI
jgi:hypothetical protein